LKLDTTLDRPVLEITEEEFPGDVSLTGIFYFLFKGDYIYLFL